MSIHGNQNVLPLFIPREKMPPLNDNEEIAVAFYLLVKDLGPSEKILTFSRLLWPFLSIQGIISTHIFLDGLLILSKKDKLTNPPRQPLIGHILRNVENRSQVDLLNRITDILTYKDSEAQELGEGEESEYQNLQIDGLVSPEILAALTKLIPSLENKPIAEYMALDASLTTEIALNLSEKYRSTIETMNGNALRWDTQIELISKEVDKWMTDLNVKIKDTESRFSSQITKTSSTIDHSQIREMLENERDKIDQWKGNEKRKIIENISSLFKTPERHMEEMIKKNKLYSRDETLKSKKIEEILPSFESQFELLKEEAKKFIEIVDSLTQKYEELKAQAKKVDIDAEERIEKLELELNAQLQNRDKQLTEVESEKQLTLTEMEVLRQKIVELYNNITQIIQEKKADCLKEKADLIKWSMEDKISEFFSKPIQWIYLPVYAMFIEDEDMMEERMNIIFPGYVEKSQIYIETSDAFKDVKNAIIQIVDSDMKIRSNFEFSCENKNFLEDPNLIKKIQKGLSTLKGRDLLNDEVESKIRDSLKLIS